MPQENKKRGRRAEALKRKREEDDTSTQASAKRRRSGDGQDSVAQGLDYVAFDADAGVEANAEQPSSGDASERPFYGMLDDDEQEYFKRADGMLEVNQFADAEERTVFLQNLHKEIKGKELKLACSQSCSRLLERLMILSSSADLKSIFAAFKGHFLHLVQHRFASHCCETLFMRSAPAVSQEMDGGEESRGEMAEGGTSQNDMEHLFLSVIDELEGNMGYLITEKFASHALRVVLLVLAGQPPDSSATKGLLQSKKKEHVDVMQTTEPAEVTDEGRAVPESFNAALRRMINDSIAGLDTGYLRTLSTHPTGNPMLQLFIRLELTCFGKQRPKDEPSVLAKLLPDDPVAEGTESASFVNGLVYDPIGSRLLETIIEFAPGKLFKSLYNNMLKERMASLARNEIAGYVVCRIIIRLSPNDLGNARDAILPLIPSLAERGRTNVIKTLVERSAIRKISMQPLADSIAAVYSDDDGRFSVRKVLDLPAELCDEAGSNTVKPQARTTPQQNAAAALLQSMLRVDGRISDLVFESLHSLPSPYIQFLAMTPALSPVLQVSLTTPAATPIFKRKMVTRLYGTIGQMSLSPSGSHVVDAIDIGTRRGLAFVRERVAEELAENEESLRDSWSGRKVWRNWRMDLYQRNRPEWVHKTRRDVGNDGFQSLPGLLGEDDGSAKDGGPARDSQQPPTGKGKGSHKRPHSGASNGKSSAARGDGSKTPLQLAREKYARAHGQRPSHVQV